MSVALPKENKTTTSNGCNADTIAKVFNSLQKEYFFKDMELIQNMPENQLPPFLGNLPSWDEDKWKGDTRNSCYNFATNIKTDTFSPPGGLQFPYRFRGYAKFNYKKRDSIANILAKDNIRPLKSDFIGCRDNEMPIALFFKETDNQNFHWFALRRLENIEGKLKYAWAHKLGEHNACLVQKKNNIGNVDIFKDAENGEYNNFAGFFAAPIIR